MGQPRLSRKVVVVFAAGLFAMVPTRVLACSCAGPRTPFDSLMASSAVFSGTAIDDADPTLLHGEDRMATATMRVGTVWKGSVGRTQAVGTGPGDCGPTFQRGERYLVYTYEFGGRHITGCTRTRPLSAAGEDLRFLDLYRAAQILLVLAAIAVLVFVARMRRARTDRRASASHPSAEITA